MSSANVHNTEERQKTTNNLNEVRETDLIQLKKMKRCKLCILQPHNKIRVIWDISIIVIIIWNCLYTPFQFAYLSNSSDMIVIDVLDKLFDFLFILDLMFQFLFAYQSPSTGELIDNPKEIAINYICKGRFFVDLVSSIPIEFILLFINTDGKQLKFIKLFKLIKLFRFGKLMTYLTTRHSIKLSLQMGEILFVLVLCTHWCNCFWYSIVQITETWVPEKDIGFEERNFFSDYTIFGQYILVYYYAISSLIGGDLVPTNQGELLAAMSLVSLGPVLIGLLIGQFTNILLDFTSKQRQKNETHDMIENMMFNLRLPIEIQNRVMEFYDMITESNYYYEKRAFDSLNDFYQDKITLLKSHETISKMPFMNTNSNEHLKMVIMNLEIESFQSGDIILKQGDFGTKFCFIIEGLVEVILENKDYKYYELNNANEFYDK